MILREQCEMLYKDAFGESKEFDKMLFDLFSDNIEIFKKDGTVAAMYFKIPCTLKSFGVEKKANYIYAVTTHSDYRRQGLMSKLFNDTLTDGNIYFLKPSSEGVIDFYRKSGFRQIIGTRHKCDSVIEVGEEFKALSSLCDKPLSEYPIMIKGNTDIEKLTFEYTLE